MTKHEELLALESGTGCLAHSHDNEPVFTLCGRDRFAADLVRRWADQVEAASVSLAEMTAQRREKIADARHLAIAMDAWRADHNGGKIPD